MKGRPHIYEERCLAWTSQRTCCIPQNTRDRIKACDNISVRSNGENLQTLRQWLWASSVQSEDHVPNTVQRRLLRRWSPALLVG